MYSACQCVGVETNSLANMQKRQRERMNMYEAILAKQIYSHFLFNNIYLRIFCLQSVCMEWEDQCVFVHVYMHLRVYTNVCAYMCAHIDINMFLCHGLHGWTHMHKCMVCGSQDSHMTTETVKHSGSSKALLHQGTDKLFRTTSFKVTYSPSTGVFF